MEFYQALLCCLVAFVVNVYLYLKYVVFTYWSRKGVPHEKAVVPLGNVPLAYFQEKMSHGHLFKESYHKFKQHRFYGVYIFNEPILVINDPELVRLILVKNFTTFHDRGSFQNQHKDPLSVSLPRLNGEKWKTLRSKITVTLTSGKLKQMYPLLKEICDELIGSLDDQLKVSDVVDMKEFTSRFTIDCISSIAFGFNCNSLKHPNDNEFYKHGKISADFGKIFVLLTFYAPELMKFYPVPESRKKVNLFFIDLFNKMVAQRKDETVARKDFLNMLVQLVNRGKLDDDDDDNNDNKEKKSDDVVESGKITMVEAVAQAVIFFAAGNETTSSAICCCLHELAFEPEIQETLQAEIDEAFTTPGGLTYEKIAQMTYLDMCFCETLRKHPGGAVLNRIALDDYVIPESNFRIPKGLRIVIPVHGLHSDPDYFPQPEKFDPQRFTPEERAKRHPFVYLPFSEGPRTCIGKRLGLLKPKIALCYLLRNYSFSVCDKTNREPLRYMNNIFVQVPDDGIYLKVVRRKLP